MGLHDQRSCRDSIIECQQRWRRRCTGADYQRLRATRCEWLLLLLVSLTSLWTGSGGHRHRKPGRRCWETGGRKRRGARQHGTEVARPVRKV